MADAPRREINLFYCYAREDKALRDELEKHLSWLKRRYQEALAAFERGIRFDAEDDKAYYGKGVALYNLERYEEAERAFGKANQLRH